ncbi:TAXI family TRAP transporter solute-binding subunit [Actinophytocola sediminis]
MTGLRCGRRAFLLFGAALTASCATTEYNGPQRTLRIAAGESGGFYKEFAELLARVLTEAEPGLRTVALESTGSIANLDLVRAGEADLALVLADAAAAASAGDPPFTEAVAVRAIGRVYENYLQLVVLANSPIRTVDDLAGRRVSLGAQGSGAALTGDRLLVASGVQAVVDRHLLDDAIDNLAEGRIDALLWSGGVPTPALAELDRRRPLRLVDIGEHIDALRDAHGQMYRRVTVPDNGYGHTRRVTTIGVPNLLVTGNELPADVADAVARVLIGRAPELVPAQALGTQYLDRRSLITTAPVPLHPGAAAAYRDLRG